MSSVLVHVVLASRPRLQDASTAKNAAGPTELGEVILPRVPFKSDTVEIDDVPYEVRWVRFVTKRWVSINPNCDPEDRARLQHTRTVVGVEAP